MLVFLRAAGGQTGIRIIRKAGTKKMAEKKETFFLIFRVGERRFAISAEQIERVLAAVEVTPLPDTPLFLRGVINCGGMLVPVVDLRVRFGLPVRRVLPSDRLVFVRNAPFQMRENGRLYAFLVEDVEGVVTLAAETISLSEFSGGLLKSVLAGLETGDDRVVCIQTADTLFSMTDAEILQLERVFPDTEDVLA
jgi:purine-binding chemotaxis protein CheW